MAGARGLWLGLRGLEVYAANQALHPHAAFDHGKPVVTYMLYRPLPGLSPIALKRWTGNEWTELTAAADDAGSTQAGTHPMVVVEPTTFDPVVAWRGIDGNVEVARRTPSAWDPIQQVPSPTGTNRVLALAYDHSARLVLAWSTPTALELRRRSGSTWEAFGADDGDAGSAPQAAALDEGDAVVAATIANGDVLVKRWNGASWSALGGNVRGAAPAAIGEPSIAVPPR